MGERIFMGLSPTACQTVRVFFYEVCMFIPRRCVSNLRLEDTGFFWGGGIEGTPQNGFFGTTPYFLAIAKIKKQNV